MTGGLMFAVGSAKVRDATIARQDVSRGAVMRKSLAPDKRGRICQYGQKINQDIHQNSILFIFKDFNDIYRFAYDENKNIWTIENVKYDDESQIGGRKLSKHQKRYTHKITFKKQYYKRHRRSFKRKRFQ
jgi:hypothetical protein